MFRHQRFREQTGVAGAALRLIRPTGSVYQKPAIRSHVFCDVFFLRLVCSLFVIQ
jgi:hypothetical protein